MSIRSILPKLFAVFISLNALCALIAAIWLLFSGAWRLVLTGVISAVVSRPIISIFLMLNFLWGAWINKRVPRGNLYITIILAFLEVAYNWIVISAWCYLVLFYAIRYSSHFEAIPTLILGFVISGFPLIGMAYIEVRGGNPNSLITAFFAQLGYIASIVLIFIGQAIPFSVILSYAAAGVIYVFILFKIAYAAK